MTHAGVLVHRNSGFQIAGPLVSKTPDWRFPAVRIFRGFMKTGLSKKQKATNIYFNEADSMIEACTYNTALKKRLTEFAGKYPSECRLIDDDGNGGLSFEVRKGRFGFKLTAPYDESRRKAASELAKKNTERLRRQE